MKKRIEASGGSKGPQASGCVRKVKGEAQERQDDASCSGRVGVQRTALSQRGRHVMRELRAHGLKENDHALIF